MTAVVIGLLFAVLVIVATALALEIERRRAARRYAEDLAQKRLTRTLDLRQAGAAVRYGPGMDAPYDQSKPVEAAKRAQAESDRRRELASRRASQGATEHRSIVSMRRTRG